MKKAHYFVMGLGILLIGACASIPSSTSKLTEEVINEANGMHALNVSLVNQLFDEREQRLNDFITYQYTPKLLDKFQKLLPDSVDYEKELPNIMKSVVPVINRKRDSLHHILSTQKAGIVSQLNTTYTAYANSTSTLQNLIDSAVKLKSAEQDVLTAIENITGVPSAKVDATAASLTNLLVKSGITAGQLTEILQKL